jgi:hypothetical protein
MESPAHAWQPAAFSILPRQETRFGGRVPGIAGGNPLDRRRATRAGDGAGWWVGASHHTGGRWPPAYPA